MRRTMPELPAVGRYRPRLSVASLLLTILPIGVHARADLPNDANAYTQREFLRDSLEFNRKTFVDAYKSVGRKNPAWNSYAVAYLDRICVYFTYVPAWAPLQPADMPTPEQLAPLGAALLNKHCDDPLVIYCHAVILQDLLRVDAAMPLYKQALSSLKVSNYPPQHVACAASSLLFFENSLKPEEREAARSDIKSNCLKMALGIHVNRAHRQTLLSQIFLLVGTGRTSQLRFY